MTMTVREPGQFALTPAEVVEGATTQAKLLMSIVEQTKCYQNIGGKKYLQVEAWETIGAFNNVHAEADWVHPLMGSVYDEDHHEDENRDTVIGYEAKVNLVRRGDVVGAAIMPCYFTENACKGKKGDAMHKAAMSAAQTFAESKAYRMNYSYVAILAGYQPTPAEEITGDEPHGDVPVEHFCAVHKTAWFKKGNMKGYAHPIAGTKEWCNEPTTAQNQSPVASPPKDVESPSEEATTALYGEAEKPVSDIQALITTIRASKPALKKDADIYRWIEARFKLTQAQVDADPNGAWEKIKGEL
jgi:hypothetical protein